MSYEAYGPQYYHLRHFARDGAISMKAWSFLEAQFEAVHYVQTHYKDKDLDHYYIIDANREYEEGDHIGYNRLSVGRDLALNTWVIMTRHPDLLTVEFDIGWWNKMTVEERRAFLVGWLGEDPRK